MKATGVNGIALVSAITAANDVEQAVRQLLKEMKADVEVRSAMEVAYAK